MRPREHFYVCVGGPLDGKRLQWSDRMAPYVRVPELHTPIPYLVPPPMLDDALVDAQLKYTTYVLDRFSANTVDGAFDEVWFWRPDDQPVMETMRRLLDRYEQTAHLVMRESPYG